MEKIDILERQREVGGGHFWYIHTKACRFLQAFFMLDLALYTL